MISGEVHYPSSASQFSGFLLIYKKGRAFEITKLSKALTP